MLFIQCFGIKDLNIAERMTVSTAVIGVVLAVVLTNVHAIPRPFECAARACMYPHCPDGEVITPPNSCCPICRPIKNKCYHTDGNTYADGASFKDKCNTCHCRDGSVACTKIGCNAKKGECPSTWSFSSCINMCKDDFECPDKQKCCRNGCGKVCRIPKTKPIHKCYRRGVSYNDRETVPSKKSDPCRICRCRNGRIRCEHMMCPACVGITRPGACCPDCSSFPWDTIA